MNFLELSNLVLPIIAIFTYLNWRANKRADQAKSALQAFYLVEYTIATMRHPWAHDLDEDTQKAADDKKVPVKYALIQKRWNDRQPEFRSFLKEYCNFKAEFSNIGTEKFEKILEIINSISRTVDLILILNDRDDSNEVRKLRAEKDKILFQDKEDKTSQEVKQVIHDMEKLCKPYIHTPLRAKYPRLKLFLDCYK